MKELGGEEYRQIVESSPNMIWRAGTDKLCNYFNRRWLEFTGRSMAQEAGNGWAQGVHPDDLDKCLKIYTEAFDLCQSFEMEYRLKRYDGEWRWINDRGVPFYNHENEFQGYIGSCVDVTEKVEGELYRWMAQFDGLTGVYNRQYFEQIAHEEFRKSKRFKHSLAVVMMDINRFKEINDLYGHLAGDQALRFFAQELRKNCRSFDLIGRFGGDEFILLMLNTKAPEAHIVMERFFTVTNGKIFADKGQKHRITASYGVASLTDEDKLEELIRKADDAMYKHKRRCMSY